MIDVAQPETKAQLERPDCHVDSYAAGGVTYRRANAEDDAHLRAILRDNDMASWVNMSFEREPSYFKAESLMGDSVSVIARRTDVLTDVVGMYAMTCLPTHINGKATDTGYLGALRVNRKYRHRLSVLKHGYASILSLAPRANLPWFTSVAVENTGARRLLEANLSGMPRYEPRGEMETMAISTQHAKAGHLLTPAYATDVDALVEFYNRHASVYQFSPVLSKAWLLGLSEHKGLRLSDFLLLKDGGSLRACVAIWDQRRIKQVVARGYRFPLSALRPAYNLFARLTGRVCLPPVGASLQQVYLSFLALDTSVETQAVDLIKEALAYAKAKGAQVGCLGLSTRNPLVPSLQTAFRPSIYRTCIETVSWKDECTLTLDGRPNQPEIALL